MDGMIYNNHLDCVRYAYTHSCPVNISKCVKNINNDCTEYINGMV